jgi:choline dehydrogenase-like flavoprotein
MADETFDYIVIGSGSAGGAVASRLSEDPTVTVLLLEAGPTDDDEMIKAPIGFSTLFKTKWDWNYETTSQKHLAGRRAYWPRMKALGGCSSMNAMIYIRGNHADYDEWRDSYGATGWGHDDVLPYFVKAENNQRLSDQYHGTTGPLWVEDRVYTHELSTAFVESAVSSGMKRNDDFNGAEQDGAGQYQVTCKKGKRWSVADAYIRPAMERSNLTVRTEAFVTRIVLDGTRATGVAYERHGESCVARAAGEIVLSGGAVNSPQLLMLSGIGPGAHLREHGIDVVVDSAGVGQNLQDHPASGLLLYTKNTTDLAEMLGIGNLLKWRATGKGALASNVGEAGGFFRSRDAVPPRAHRLLRQRHARAGPSRRDRRGHARPRREPRPAATALGRSELAPRDRRRLLRRPRRSRGDDRGLPPGARDRPAGSVRAVRRVAVGACHARSDRRGDHRHDRPARPDAVPPGRHLCDGHDRGQRRRPRAQGARHRRPPGRRRLRHATGPAWQHQRPVHHDR